MFTRMWLKSQFIFFLLLIQSPAYLRSSTALNSIYLPQTRRDFILPSLRRWEPDLLGLQTKPEIWPEDMTTVYKFEFFFNRKTQKIPYICPGFLFWF